MAETEAPPAAPAAPNGESQAKPPPLTLTAQYLKDLSFENPAAPQSLGDLTPPPAIKVDIDVEARQLGSQYYEAMVHVRATAERDEKTFFVIEVSYGGVCSVSADVPESHIQPLIMIEGPRLLFPFVRAIISDSVRDGGFPPLLINPIDFTALYRQMQNRPEETTNATPPEEPTVTA